MVPFRNIDFGDGFEAGESSPDVLILFIPNKDQYGAEFGTQRRWVLEALELLTEINGGATASQPVEGWWMDSAGAVVRESPVIVYSFVRPEPFATNSQRIVEFLRRMGRETNQGEVGFIFAGNFYRLRSFDEN